MTVRVVLPTGFGINCEAETSHAFQRAGATVDSLHLNDLLEKPALLAGADILALAGGFSFGDHLGAGRVLANRLHYRLEQDLTRHVDGGGLVIGICNGFQTMARLGLLPAGRPGKQTVSLVENTHGAFYDGWVRVAMDPLSPCVFTRGIEAMDIPVRHGEGRFIASDEAYREIQDNHLAALHYVDPDTGLPTSEFPQNPNGSRLGIAGVCDVSGRIFGLMPHPEAFLYPENHPHWRHRPSSPTGIEMFRNAVQFCKGL
jgi:phosphoribosylformylglycinamidine synthase subunit PurQ / glutaminase